MSFSELQRLIDQFSGLINLVFSNQISKGTVGNESLIFIDDSGWMRRPRALRSRSVKSHRRGPTYKSCLLHAINFCGYREVWSEAATGTSPTETSGGWGTLHPSKQVSLPRGQHQQYPIHYKGQKEKEGGKQGGERNNKHLFTVTVVTFSPIYSMIYDQLLEKPCGGLIDLGGCRTGALVWGVEFDHTWVE